MKMKIRNSGRFVLKDKRPIPCEDLEEWARWLDVPGSRHVAEDTIDGVLISTVFMGLDHSFVNGDPVLFETMIFGGEHDQYCERCCTWDEALDMHAKALKLVDAPTMMDTREYLDAVTKGNIH